MELGRELASRIRMTDSWGWLEYCHRVSYDKAMVGWGDSVMSLSLPSTTCSVQVNMTLWLETEVLCPYMTLWQPAPCLCEWGWGGGSEQKGLYVVHLLWTQVCNYLVTFLFVTAGQSNNAHMKNIRLITCSALSLGSNGKQVFISTMFTVKLTH